MPFEEEKAIIRRLIDEVQTGGDFVVFEELFAMDFVDHTPFPGYSPDRDGARNIYVTFRTGFPDFRVTLHRQLAEDGLVTNIKTYHGTHLGAFMGLEPTGRSVDFDVIDVYRVRNRQITDHWGVANVWSVMQQLGVAPLTEVAAPGGPTSSAEPSIRPRPHADSARR